MDSPISGMEEAAGGVDSASNNSRTKKATNIFIPAKDFCIFNFQSMEQK